MADIFDHIQDYAPYDEREASDLEKLQAFMAQHEDDGEDMHENLFSRSNLKGHITSSAWVVNTTLDKALLLKHKTLGYWLMPGGHADGSADILEMAKREVAEETGIENVTVLGDGIFDLDVHGIPAAHKHGKDEPEHTHYDVRYLLVASEDEPIKIAEDESDDVKWIPFDEILPLHPGWVSGARMIEKTKKLRSA